MQKSYRNGEFVLHRLIFYTTISSCALAAGCQDVATIWSAQTPSPDGLWIVDARTEQYGGLGTAAVITVVKLQRVHGSSSSVEILNLSYDSAYPAGSTAVKVSWLTPTHLDISFNSRVKIDFQAVRYAGIDISASRLTD